MISLTRKLSFALLSLITVQSAAGLVFHSVYRDVE